MLTTIIIGDVQVRWYRMKNDASARISSTIFRTNEVFTVSPDYPVLATACIGPIICTRRTRGKIDRRRVVMRSAPPRRGS